MSHPASQQSERQQADHSYYRQQYSEDAHQQQHRQASTHSFSQGPEAGHYPQYNQGYRSGLSGANSHIRGHKPPLRSDTSSSTGYSTMSSMTSSSTSAADQLSPKSVETSASSPYSQDWADQSGKNQRYTHGQHHSSGHGTNVSEQSLKAARPTSGKVSNASYDAGNASGSSTDTAKPRLEVDNVQKQFESTAIVDNKSITPLSSSPSSSSCSNLSDAGPGHRRGVYETPLTADVEELAESRQSEHSHYANSGVVKGYPFPNVSGSSAGEKLDPRSSSASGKDPWQHTDDLLAPSGKPTIGKMAQASVLSLSKPSLTSKIQGSQPPSGSQSTTPLAVDINHGSPAPALGQSKAAKHRSSADAASSSELQGLANAKLSSSTSPPSGSGLTGFSPLSPHVEPFSPSCNNATLPSKLSTVSQVKIPSAPFLAQSSLQGAPAPTAQLASNPDRGVRESNRHTGSLTGERPLDSSRASSSGDTGYYSAYEPVGGISSSHDAQSSGSSTSHQRLQYDTNYHVADRRTDDIPDASRQRFWSTHEDLDPQLATPYGQHGQGSMAGHGRSWVQPHQQSTEHNMVPLSSHFNPAYSHPEMHAMAHHQQMHNGAGYMPSLASLPHRGVPLPHLHSRGLPPSHSLENFDTPPYGYGPPSVSDASTAGTEEISTIFVVGFPEDIQEREFHNMFIFARGFEAATLKIPASTAAARERDAAAAAAVSAIAATLPAFSAPPPPPALDPHHGYGRGNSSTGSSSYDHLNTSLYEETFLAAQASANAAPGSAKVENAHRVSSALAAAALTASASTVNLANTTNRKQIIGFAKFRTRDDAMIARDLLSGRKIDPEKGCVLKAEMAKKNLHIKKNGSEPVTLVSLAPETSAAGPRESASALDKLAERERHREWLARMEAASMVGMSAQSDHNERALDANSDRAQRSAQWQDAAYDAFHSVASVEKPGSSARDLRYASSSQHAHQAGYDGQSVDRTPLAPQVSSASARQRMFTGNTNFGKTLLQQLDDQEDVTFNLPDANPGFGASAYQMGGDDRSSRRQPPPAALPNAHKLANTGSLAGHSYIDEDYRTLSSNKINEPSHGQDLHRQPSHEVPISYASHQPLLNSAGYMHNATTPTSAAPATLGAGGRRYTSPDLVSPALTEFRQPRTQNRADDNNPIATLYVGGLPSALPNLAGSVSSSQLEDALRAVFSRCPGFRRMSYRQKSQGPMCFIEFDDTHNATRALNEAYGHTLGGLVKGGIRLAYSKNPLGVRGSASSGPDSPGPLSPSYFASDIYGQSSYYGSPATASNLHAQAPTPTQGTRPLLYDQADDSRLMHYGSEYSSPPASQQAFAFNQRQHQAGADHYQPGGDHRYSVDRSATSPNNGGTMFSPFAMDR